MTRVSDAETIPFTPVFSEMEPYPSKKADGSMIYPRPMAKLVFPDANSTVRFINAALDTVYGVPVSVASFRSDGKASIGHSSEFDAAMNVTEDGEVHMFITLPFGRTAEAHARLREFVLETIGIVVAQEDLVAAE